MANIGAITVPVNLELAEASPALQQLIREMVRQEVKAVLEHLDPQTAKPLTEVVSKQLTQKLRMQMGTI